MRTRGQIRAAVEPDAPLLQVLPATRNNTLSNASSPLLKLPPEIKNSIYELVLGGNYIHVEAVKDKPHQYRLWQCAATVSDTAAQQDFDSSGELPAQKFDPHKNCSWRWDPAFVPVHLSFDLVLTCREIYAEARDILYTTNTLSFQDPKLLCKFILDASNHGGHNAAIRHLRVAMGIRRRREEEAWNVAFRTISQSLSGLLSIHIYIEQIIWNNARYLPSMGKKKTFLTAIEDLKALKLTDMTLIVDDYGRWPDGESAWNHTKKQEWARMVKASVLDKDAVVD